jgi:hypothetical protein
MTASFHLPHIDADTNTRRVSRINPKRSALVRKAYEATMTIWSQRAARGDMRWCYCPECQYVVGRLLGVHELCLFAE